MNQLYRKCFRSIRLIFSVLFALQSPQVSEGHVCVCVCVMCSDNWLQCVRVFLSHISIFYPLGPELKIDSEVLCL